MSEVTPDGQDQPAPRKGKTRRPKGQAVKATPQEAAALRQRKNPDQPTLKRSRVRGNGGAPAAVPAQAIRDGLINASVAERKRTYALMSRAVEAAFDIPFDALRLACVTAVKDLGSDNDRIRSRAREFLFKVQEQGMDAGVNLDRLRRLDEGLSTENVAVASITPEALAAVVQSIRLSADK
jgi:hypothetical protein